MAFYPTQLLAVFELQAQIRRRLLQNTIANDPEVKFISHEATECIFWGADNRLSLYVEALL